MSKTVIYEADDGFVVFNSDNMLKWYWDNGDNKGEYLIPFSDTVDYFESAGREDIADLIYNRETCIYGRYGTF